MRPGVVIGVHAHAEPERLIETVRSLPSPLGDGAGIVLLPDGPDAALSAALASDPILDGLPQWGTAEPLGAPACFNRLASGTDAAMVVFVESGTVLGPVIDAIGAADPDYGLGPCWEMDYNIRAARAGFLGVWVCGAYAFRYPPTARRLAGDRRQMDRSRRLYQDRFCGQRLTGQRADYESHCRGEACEYFAPASLITLRRPLAVTCPAVITRP